MSSCCGTPLSGVADRRAFGDADLRPHDVDAGDGFGHRVLDLDARIDLDEIELAGVGVLQELDRAGVEIAHGAADLERLLAQRRAAAASVKNVAGARSTTF